MEFRGWICHCFMLQFVASFASFPLERYLMLLPEHLLLKPNLGLLFSKCSGSLMLQQLFELG